MHFNFYPLAKRPIVTVFQSIPAESEPNRTIVADCCVPVTFLLEVQVHRLPEIRWMFKDVPILDNNTNYNISDTVEEERGVEHYFKVNTRRRSRAVHVCACECVCYMQHTQL